MSFAQPFGLLGLALIPLLILLDRWRRRPRPRVWPSLLLWRAVRESGEPQARRVDPVLLYECLAVALLSLAAAGPTFAGAVRPAVLALLDVGPHMQARRADGTTVREATLRELERIGPDRIDDVEGDLVRAAVGASRDRIVVLGTDRPHVEGPGYVVVGRAANGDNVGIDAIEVKGDRLWFALATDGEPRLVSVMIDRTITAVETGKGFETELASTIAVMDDDNYPGDDRCELRPLLLKVRDETGSPFVAAALNAGTPTAPGEPPDLVVTTSGGEPAADIVRGLDCIADAGLFEGLFLDECAWRGARTREGPGLLTWNGRALARWLDETTLWIGLPLDREWDEHGTLALVVERAKRERAKSLLREGEALVGDAVASPAPGFVNTKGVDRPWDGSLPATEARVEASRNLRTVLALLAAAVLALLVRAIVLRS